MRERTPPGIYPIMPDMANETTPPEIEEDIVMETIDNTRSTSPNVLDDFIPENLVHYPKPVPQNHPSLVNINNLRPLLTGIETFMKYPKGGNTPVVAYYKDPRTRVWIKKVLKSMSHYAPMNDLIDQVIYNLDFWHNLNKNLMIHHLEFPSEHFLPATQDIMLNIGLFANEHKGKQKGISTSSEAREAIPGVEKLEGIIASLEKAVFQVNEVQLKNIFDNTVDIKKDINVIRITYQNIDKV